MTSLIVERFSTLVRQRGRVMTWQPADHTPLTFYGFEADTSTDADPADPDQHTLQIVAEAESWSGAERHPESGDLVEIDGKTFIAAEVAFKRVENHLFRIDLWLQPTGIREWGIRVWRLTEAVTFLRESEALDNEGGSTDSLEEVATVAAMIHPKSGGEEFISGRIKPKAKYKMTILRRTDLNEDMKVRWGDYTLSVVFIGRNSDTEKFMNLELTMDQA